VKCNSPTPARLAKFCKVVLSSELAFPSNAFSIALAILEKRERIDSVIIYEDPSIDSKSIPSEARASILTIALPVTSSKEIFKLSNIFLYFLPKAFANSFS